MRGPGVGLWIAAICAAVAFGAPPAQGATGDPLFVFTPPPSVGVIAPPLGYLNGSCGLAVDSAAQLYVSDHYHDVVDVFTPGSSASPPGYVNQIDSNSPLDGPCGVALDSSGRVYVNNFHRNVVQFSALPAPGGGTSLPLAPTDTVHHLPTGVAVDAAGRVYVDERTYIAVYDSSGAPVLEGGSPLRIGVGTLGDAYGVAVSQFPATLGYLYVPDAATNTVKVYDPLTSTTTPVDEIKAPSGGPFTSLRESAAAVDRVTGRVYISDNTQPASTEQSQAIVYVYDSTGAPLGHLKYKVVDALPPGIAVDNSAAATQGRVYVTSGNTHHSGIYVYPPGAAVSTPPLAPGIPAQPLGGGPLAPSIPIGGPTAGGVSPQIACEGDNCQVLPRPPVDPTLTTLLSGPGNPAVRYSGSVAKKCHGRTGRTRSKGAHAKRGRPAAGKCARHGHNHRHGSASASAAVSGASTAQGSVAPEPAVKGTSASSGAAGSSAASAPPTSAATLLPGATGFAAAVGADGGAASTQAGSHPYRLALTLGLSQAAGAADLRNLRVDLPPGLLVDPAAAGLCSSLAFGTPRSSPFESSHAGESCPDRSQVGTIDVRTGAGGGETRRFGIFNLSPPDGSVARFGASPDGSPILFDAHLRSDDYGLTLQVTDLPQSLHAHGLELALWGAPGDASHDVERGNCLNEAEPGFAWSKCSLGEPTAFTPLAYLTLPGACSPTLAFAAAVNAWQQLTTATAQAVNRDSGGAPAPLGNCSSLGFDPRAEGVLSTKKASSSSGFVFRFKADDPGLTDPRARIHSLVRGVTVALPTGVTLNPSLGAGLAACTPAEYAAETVLNAQGDGCPSAAKIGDFNLRSPFYSGLVRGAIYIAAPHDNPFNSLLALYLVAKSADRGVLVKVAGKLTPNADDGTLTASFDGLPQLPYSELEVSFRSNQRAPLVTPSACGPATTHVELAPWSGSTAAHAATDSQIDSGTEGSPCPQRGAPPFSPGAVAGGVNSNVNSYTPYFVHLTRTDSEQEFTSYSLTLPKGITGKLAGIPFCSDGAIAAARANGGFAETANPSCPEASRVGRTVSGYGVGSALAYAPGKIYLAGPYHGAPLSLVTVNAATVGPFDLGTVVVRSAFDVDPLTAQLQIDSRASDPIPHIIDGIPLHLRDIRVYMDRPEFTHNPSSCEAAQLVSTVNGSGASLADRADDSTATIEKHFQLLNCLTLGFQPSLGLRLRGSASRGAFPALRASFAARGPRDSNLKRIEVDMPHQLFLAQNHIREVCTRVQFAAGRCPANSVYGTAVAYTPLLDEPLRGNVYLRSSDNKLPDLVTSLYSGAVRIDLVGRIGPSKQGGIQAFFDNLPDAPIDRFVMSLRGGKRGLLTNSVNICAAPPQAEVKALGQNNRGRIFATTLRGQCQKTGKKHGSNRLTERGLR